ncbi:response regulator [Leptolyngbya sp. FACHB-541]|uniref:response regulator n=1 Tax=Leptolyngbya sp. FACHB-541 TaxID=2692810 RepID=UPI0016897562|nr:response regulator [Leptolyngbya sp. FACHB-541]MBD1995733.1 response regulator [Leptolyngbya sp. FACHB-541]
MDSASHQPTPQKQLEKLKLLVVDDEPDNLDLLYRTFRRDFHVLRAESGKSALEVLATEGEVAIIISDQRMPEMKGTEFLSKTVPQFPNTIRIILTGFTDVEDLVEAINAGQVYKYITKPWDPSELRAVVKTAAETYELSKRRAAELRLAQTQALLLSTIVQVVQQATSSEARLKAIATAFAESFAADGCVLKPATENVAAAPITPETVDLDATAELTDLTMPITLQDERLAVLSLYWQQPRSLTSAELSLLHLAVQQVALALSSTRYRRAVV